MPGTLYAFILHHSTLLTYQLPPLACAGTGFAPFMSPLKARSTSLSLSMTDNVGMDYQRTGESVYGTPLSAFQFMNWSGKQHAAADIKVSSYPVLTCSPF